jgi:hypothetical protein
LTRSGEESLPVTDFDRIIVSDFLVGFAGHHFEEIAVSCDAPGRHGSELCSGHDRLRHFVFCAVDLNVEFVRIAAAWTPGP